MTQCNGTTKSGDPCSREATDGEYCYQHEDSPESRAARDPMYDPEKVAKAVRKQDGNLTYAAEMIGCHRRTVARYCKEFEVCRDAKNDSREKIVDLARTKLQDKILDGDTKAIKIAIQNYDNETEPDKKQLDHKSSDGSMSTDCKYDQELVKKALEELSDADS